MGPLWRLLVLLLSLYTLSSAQPSPVHTLQIRTIRTAYEELGNRVSQTLQIQVGDVAQIQRQAASAQEFLQSVVQVSVVFYSHLQLAQGVLPAFSIRISFRAMNMIQSTPVFKTC